MKHLLKKIACLCITSNTIFGMEEQISRPLMVPLYYKKTTTATETTVSLIQKYPALNATIKAKVTVAEGKTPQYSQSFTGSPFAEKIVYSGETIACDPYTRFYRYLNLMPITDREILNAAVFRYNKQSPRHLNLLLNNETSPTIHDWLEQWQKRPQTPRIEYKIRE